MKKRINHLVLVEKKPICYLDCLDFEVDGQHFTMTHGTFRNKISKLVREGFVELQYRSGPAFYSLPGHNFTKRKIMTQDRKVVASMSSMSSVSSNFIDSLPLTNMPFTIFVLGLKLKAYGLFYQLNILNFHQMIQVKTFFLTL